MTTRSMDVSAPGRGLAEVSRTPAPPLPGTGLIDALLRQGVLSAEEWAELPPELRAEVAAQPDTGSVLTALVGRHLLTYYQAELVRQGRAASLTLGQYRLLDPLGRGGMGVVYRAEHRHLRRPVAVKVLGDHCLGNQQLLGRFLLEARAVARLRHPNIVTCNDAGCDAPTHLGGAAREYYAMDLIPGADLQATVTTGGPLPVHRACDLGRQVAEALAEAHRVGLVHRDIKPGNILVTPDWQARVLDFGLARHADREMTAAGTLLGSVGYMAPEQADDPSGVDGRADVFALGATLYLALTGREPFPPVGSPLADIRRRANAPPPRVRDVRPDVPPGLDDLVARLMNPDPDRRFPSAAAAAAALLPFSRWRPGAVADAPARHRVLVVDDDADVRDFTRALLEDEYEYVEAADGREGLALVEAQRFDLVVVDQEMPGLDGAQLITRMLQTAPRPGPMVLYMSGRAPTEALGGLLLGGADDFIRKPFQPTEFLSRVRGLIGRRTAAGPRSGDRKPVDTGPEADETGLMALAVCYLLEEVGAVSRGYHVRLPQYIDALAAAVRKGGSGGSLTDPEFVLLLRRAAVAHDIGMATVPPSIVNKPGRLDGEERLAVQTHPTTGADLLARLAAQRPGAEGLGLAAEAARHHHERWDGGGYPDGRAGEAIPLAARVVGLAATYDALRSRRPYRPGVSHPRAVQVIAAESGGQFDPTLAAAFATAADQFDRIFLTSAR